MRKIFARVALFGVVIGLAGCVQPGACRPVAVGQAAAPPPAPVPAPVHPAPAAAPAEPGYYHAGGGAFY